MCEKYTRDNESKSCLRTFRTALVSLEPVVLLARRNSGKLRCPATALIFSCSSNSKGQFLDSLKTGLIHDLFCIMVYGESPGITVKLLNFASDLFSRYSQGRHNLGNKSPRKCNTSIMANGTS